MSHKSCSHEPQSDFGLAQLARLRHGKRALELTGGFEVESLEDGIPLQAVLGQAARLSTMSRVKLSDRAKEQHRPNMSFALQMRGGKGSHKEIYMMGLLTDPS